MNLNSITSGRSIAYSADYLEGFRWTDSLDVLSRTMVKCMREGSEDAVTLARHVYRGFIRINSGFWER